MPEISAVDVLNSLTAHIAVLDERGTIIAVNDAWKRFAEENGADDRTAYLGANYLSVCERSAADDADGTVRSALDGLRALMRGETELFVLEYPCNSATEDRWFCLRATRAGGGGGAVVIAHENITLRRRSEDALRDAERTFRQVLDTLPVGVWILNRAGRVIHGNPAGQRIWSGALHVGPEQFGARAIRTGEVSVDEEIEIECSDGTHKIIANSAMPLRDERGEIAGAITVNQDISARKQIERELARTLARERTLARTDDLTGAFNRRYFFELAAHEMAVARRYRQPLAVILFDIDHFKAINDSAGHDAGDEALRRVAHIVGDHLREADLFARYGGEEFILLLPQATARQAEIVAERIRQEISSRGRVNLHGVTSITISCGVAELLDGDDSIDRIVSRADNALYRAKHEGRNRTVLAAGPLTV